MWGATDAEIDDDYPCAALVPEPAARMIRAVDVAAPAAVTFRWVQQLTRAPYSYDLVDNLGRRSPRTLTPSAERLARGQSVMRIFRLVDYRIDEHLTLALVHPRSVRLFGDIVVTSR